MSADILRRAASLMRENAKAAKATGVWRNDGTDKTTPQSGPFTHHVATFANPDVALAVAALLDREAEVTDEMVALNTWYAMGPNDPVLAVARSYLGVTA